MRVVGDDVAALAAEVAGSTRGDRLEVNVWRGGTLMVQGLDVTSWSLSWDADRQVQGQATFVVADPDGTLAPWGLSDPLGPGGSRLQVTYTFGSSGLRVPLGWWRIRRAEPSESWRVYRSAGRGSWSVPPLSPSDDLEPSLVLAPSDGASGFDPGEVVRVPGGGTVTVQADEETSTIVKDRMDAEAWAPGSTCLGEVTRLLEDICPVVVDGAVVDAPVPSDLVYGLSRMDAVEDLLDAVRAVHRMGPDGSLQVVPASGVGPVWSIQGGDDGALVRLARALSDEDVYNAAVSSAETETGAPLVGRAFHLGGPLAWGGPFGRVPIFHNAIATTQAGVDADAATVLATRTDGGEVDLAVTCLTHPGVQPQDRVTVVAATRAGEQGLEGRVVGMNMRSVTVDGGTVPAKSMDLRVRVSVQALEAVAGRVRRA